MEGDAGHFVTILLELINISYQGYLFQKGGELGLRGQIGVGRGYVTQLEQVTPAILSLKRLVLTLEDFAERYALGDAVEERGEG